MTGKGPLTERELRILSLVSHGFSNADIGEDIGISKDSARNYCWRIQVALGASDRAHAVRIGFEDGLLTPSVVRRPRVPRRRTGGQSS